MAANKQTIPSVWARQRKRREQPALSPERIVAEALSLLDEKGIDALSMRTLGTRLNAGATSLYRHVANKDELIELVVDEVYGEVEVPEVADPKAWREQLAVTAHSLRAMILRHPWVASVLGQVALVELGPNLMRQSERMLGLFRAAGFDLADADRANSALTAYVVGIAGSEASFLSLMARSGQDPQEWTRSLRETAEQIAEEQPLLKEYYTQVWPKGDMHEWNDENFVYGLDLFLDGITVRLSAQD
ncbi:TetR/AcrR family transcriptional regulator [Nonomuraea longicatena]|uniref:TetR/AcrR family transcriptional regulator C-terminal domain-containing protein n=1 Tax=Nonomuraea longicatena TaxID=83682 RepID=A0ABP3Z8Q4_9ACTN